ncbi:hypothetical protein [Streptomyces sp. NPDC059071]
MNDSLSLAADLLTIAGSLFTITLEVLRARREARRAGQGGEPPKE